MCTFPCMREDSPAAKILVDSHNVSLRRSTLQQPVRGITRYNQPTTAPAMALSRMQRHGECMTSFLGGLRIAQKQRQHYADTPPDILPACHLTPRVVCLTWGSTSALQGHTSVHQCAAALFLSGAPLVCRPPGPERYLLLWQLENADTLRLTRMPGCGPRYEQVSPARFDVRTRLSASLVGSFRPQASPAYRQAP